jgi:asparagine synthase (glutamine-hydrolysing)
MCGISGIISLKGNTADPRMIQRMNDTLRHRGPDGDGFLFFSDSGFVTACGEDTPENVRHARHDWSPQKQVSQVSDLFQLCLAHRRLAILDLSENGHQPLCNSSRDLWITYNGEIYNHIELRKQLESKGHIFRTRTDTEVILAAYQEWGMDCVKQFNGMWAFVLFDKKKKRIFGSRDRFGVKPFYYHINEERFLFASEQKSILQHPSVARKINIRALSDFFITGETDYSEQGFFDGIMELFPSNSFTLDLTTREFKKWIYYELHTNEKYENFNASHFEEYRSRTEELIRDAIRIRLRSDVPVGSCLSGGIDSSSIVGMMHELRKGKKDLGAIHTFTSSFSDPDFDESKWAKIVSDAAGTTSHMSRPSREEMMADLEQLVYCQDSPVWSTSTYAQFRVMKLARDSGTKVILDGQGGDELFAGYSPYYTWYIGDMMRRLEIGKALRAVRDFDSFPQNFKSLGKDYLKLKAIHHLPVSMQLKISKSYFADMSFLDPSLLESFKTNHRNTETALPRSLNGILLKEFVNTRLKNYLKCEDRCSMWHSVESRTPYADDHPLIEYVFNIPGVYKIHQGTNKYLMREAVRSVIPDQILSRTDKMGYATPNNKWVTEMREEMRPYFTDILKPYIKLDKLKKDYDSFFDIEGKPENGRVFKFMIFAVWMKVFEMK